MTELKRVVRPLCDGCKHLSSEYFKVQGDTGRDYYCNHYGEPKNICTYDAITPEWCPLIDIRRHQRSNGWETELRDLANDVIAYAKSEYPYREEYSHQMQKYKNATEMARKVLEDIGQ